MKKILIALLVVVVAGFSICKLQNPRVEDINKKPIIKIGVVFSLSGSDSEGNNNVKNALIYLAEQYKSSPVKYEIIPEDSAGQPSKGITVSKKLINVDDVEIIISSKSSVSKAIAPYLAQNGVAHIALSSDRETAKGDTNFIFWITPEEHADKMVKLLNKYNYKKVIAFVLSDATAMIRYNALAKIAPQNGIDIEKIQIMTGTRNFSNEIYKAAEMKPDALLLLTHDPEIDILGKQIKETDLNIPLTTMEFFSYSKHKDLFEGYEFVNTTDGDEKTIKNIMQAINVDNPFGLAYAHDTMAMINEVASKFYKKNNRVPNGKEISDGLLKLKEYKGAIGDIIIDENGVMNPQAVFKVIKNGQAVVVEE